VVLMIGTFLLMGQIALTDLVSNADPWYVAAGGAGAVVLIAVGAYFRRTLFTLPLRTVGGLFATHLGRFLVLNYVLRIVQWMVVLPEAPLSVWATMLAVKSFVSRLPLIPSKDLVGTGAVLGLSSVLAASEASIAAMLLMHTALKKVFNLLFFAVLAAVPDPPEQAALARNGSDDEEEVAGAPEPAEVSS
jgi:hypothetical protein